MQVTAAQESSVSPGAVHYLWSKRTDMVIFTYQLQKLVSSKFGLNWALASL